MEIELISRYGSRHKLVPMPDIGENIYKYVPAEDWMPMRYIFDKYDENAEENDLVAADPDGGPFISLGSKIENKTVTRIYDKKGVGTLIELK